MAVVQQKTWLRNRSETNCLQARGLGVAFQARHAYLIPAGLGKSNPADRKLLIIVRRVLLVLDVLPTLHVDAPYKTTFPRVGEVDAIVARREDVDFPDRLSMGLPVMYVNDSLPFAELLQPSVHPTHSSIPR